TNTAPGQAGGRVRSHAKNAAVNVTPRMAPSLGASMDMDRSQRASYWPIAFRIASSSCCLRVLGRVSAGGAALAAAAERFGATARASDWVDGGVLLLFVAGRA